MKRSWCPADSFRIGVTKQFRGCGTAVARPRRPYGVTQLETGQDSTVPQPGGDHGGASQWDDDAHPERRRMRTEAVLLLAKTSLSPRKLAQLAHLADATEARTLVRQLNQVYDTLGRAIRVEQVAGGFRMMTRPALAPWLARLGHLPQTLRLSTPMMETLAVVAYRQPVSRASAEAVRGVACGELLRQLMERDLIRIVGRGEELGRPYLYGTTKSFLQLFGLPDVDALPPIEWHTLHEDETDQEYACQDIPEDPSTSTKEPVVTNTIAPVLDEATLSEETEANLRSAAPPLGVSPAPSPVAVDDDEDEDEDWDDEEDWDDDEEDLDDDDDLDDEEDLDDDDDDLDDDDLEDEELEESELEVDEDLDEEDDLEEDDWEEVDDDDEEWDDDDDEEWDDDDDESAEDDEDWE